MLKDPWSFLAQNGGKQHNYPRPNQNTNTGGDNRLATSEQNDMNIWQTQNDMTEEEGARPEEDDTNNTQSLPGNSSSKQGPENQKQNSSSAAELLPAGQSGSTINPVSQSTGGPTQGSGNNGNGNNGGNNLGNSGRPGGSPGNSAGGNQGSGTQSQGAVNPPIIGVALVSNGGANIGTGLPGANSGPSGSTTGNAAGIPANSGQKAGRAKPLVRSLTFLIKNQFKVCAVYCTKWKGKVSRGFQNSSICVCLTEKIKDRFPGPSP